MANFGLALYLVGFFAEKYIFVEKNTPEITWLHSLVGSQIVFFIKPPIPL